MAPWNSVLIHYDFDYNVQCNLPDQSKIASYTSGILVDSSKPCSAMIGQKYWHQTLSRKPLLAGNHFWRQIESGKM